MHEKLPQEQDDYRFGAATVAFEEDGTLLSERFGDIYYSRQAGIAESRYTFVEPSRVVERFDAESSLSIGELGFGSGLNFLATAATLLSKRCCGRLHYYAIEGYPLAAVDLSESLSFSLDHYRLADSNGSLTLLDDANEALFCETLVELSAELVELYPPLAPGQHRLRFESARRRGLDLYLDLAWGEAAAMLGEAVSFGKPIDLWYLDGFAPARNPSMWRDEVMREVSRLSKNGASLTTFSSARAVRDSLEAADFLVSKRPGFGKKKESILAIRQTKAATPKSKQTVQRVIVIGGGIAGASVAHTLTDRGIEVELIERQATLARGGSGNHAGALDPGLTRKPTPLSRLSFTALGHLHRLLAQIKRAASEGRCRAVDFDICGLAHLDHNEERTARHAAALENLLLDTDLLRRIGSGDTFEALTGSTPEPASGLWLSQCGYLRPPQLVEALIDLARSSGRLQLQLDCEVESIDFDERNRQWHAHSAGGQTIASADAIVIANAHEAKQFSQLGELPLRQVRGQVAHLEANSSSRRLRAIICHEHYILPAVDQLHVTGATYSEHLLESDYRSDESDLLFASLQSTLPQLNWSEPIGGRVSFRCASKDRLPLVGEAPDLETFCRRPWSRREPGSIGALGREWRIERLYLTLAHGSRGLLFAPLAAEILAAQICGDFSPIESDLLSALDPARFYYRDWRRNNLPTR